MSRSFFPGRPRRERRVFVSSARNKPLSLDFLRPYRDGLDEFEKIVTKELGDEKPFEGFTRLEIRECTNRYLSCAQLEDEEFFPMNHRARKPIQGPISSTPKLKKGSKMPVRNLALHFEELTSVKEPTIELDEADHPTVPVKRGRGRPRKSNNDEVTNKPTSEPKKRGRKRKILFEDTNFNKVETQQPGDNREIIWKSVINVVDEFLQQQLKSLQFTGNMQSLESLMNQTKTIAARCANYA